LVEYLYKRLLLSLHSCDRFQAIDVTQGSFADIIPRHGILEFDFVQTDRPPVDSVGATESDIANLMKVHMHVSDYSILYRQPSGETPRAAALPDGLRKNVQPF
jgi:hypothetical protein